jgi:uncharacterized protein (TIGR03067 family)
MRTTFALLAICLLVASGDSEAIKKEMEQLEGEWTMVSGERDGQSLPEDLLKEAKRVAKAGETTVTIGGQLFLKARFTIDPAKKPKTIDYTLTDGPNKGQSQRGIYELDGDTVKFCFASPGKERPTEFKTMAESARTLSVWKRSNPAEADHIIPNPPQFLIASGINEKEQLVLQKYQHVTRLPASAKDKPTGSSYKSSDAVSLKGVTIISGDGKEISVAEARKVLTKESPILVMSGGEKPSSVYLKAVSKDILIFVFPADAPVFEKARWPVEKS